MSKKPPPMIIDSHGSIKGLNLRKVGKANVDEHLEIDIKIGDVPVDIAFLALMLGSTVEEVTASFWMDNKDKDRRFTGLEPIGSWLMIMHAEVVLSGVHLSECKISGFLAELHGGLQCTLTFKVTVEDPPDDSVALLAEYMKREIEIQIWRAQSDILDPQS